MPRNTAATGQAVHKQVYLYGTWTPAHRDPRSFGMAWGMGGWLLFPFLQKIGAEAAQACASAWRTS
jgi:NADPH2:quinone reductase